MSKKIAIPRGTNDIWPDDIDAWQIVEKGARQLFEIYGYREIRTPIYEDASLFERSLGQTSDIVKKQLLRLATDKKKGLALRPEGTASIVRSYIEHSYHKKEPITKLYYIGPMFRGERPQKGRFRQFHQLGVEAIGPGAYHPFLDAEVIALSVHYLKTLGWAKPKLVINSLGSTDDKNNFSILLRKELKPFVNDLSEYSKQRYQRNVFRILDSKEKQDVEIVRKLSIDYSYLSKESQTYFHRVKAVLDSWGIDYDESPYLVRGLDYYTHTVFEISDSSLGSQNALGAGGRYNTLYQDLGGDPKTDIGAVGFSFGIERILLAGSLKQKVKRKKVDVYVIGLDEPSFQKALDILNVLRQEGISSDSTYSTASLKSQMRSANKAGTRYVIIVGEKELQQETVLLKNMINGEQQHISIANGKINSFIDKIKGHS